MVVQDKAYMANIKNSNRSASMGAIADALLSGKSGLNEYEIKKWLPLIGGTGLGDIFMGQAPELVDDVSYYGPQAAFKGGNRVSGGLGTLQPKRETFDAAMLGMDATGLASLVTKMGKGSLNLAKSGLYNNKINKLISTPKQEIDDAYNWSVSQGANFPTESEGKAWIKDLLSRSKRAALEEKHDLPVDKVSEMLKNLTQEQFQKERGYSKKAIDNWNSYLSTVEKGKNYNLDMDTIAGLEYNPTAPNYNELYKSGQHPLYNRSLNNLFKSGDLSRRDFLKGSAAVAGGVALGGLLKLGKETGEQVAKHSTDNVASKVAKEAPKKYKYNSLKEYADDLNRRTADEIAPDLNPMYDQELPHNYNMVNDPKYVDGYSRYIKENLALYNKAKTLIAKDKPINYQEADSFGAFSPQAKAEMKELKRHYQINYDMDNGILPGGSTGWIELLDDAVQPGFWNTVYPK